MNKPETAPRIGDNARFERVRSLLNQAIANRAFPGASISVSVGGELVTAESFGHFTYDQNSPTVIPETVFDLASLTKVIATTAMAMLLHEHRQFQLEQRVCEIVPEFAEGADARKRDVTFRMLLAHSSGLPSHVKFFEDVSTRDELLRAAFAVPLEADPMSRAAYSDIGFIVLGVVLERIVKESLDSICAREIFKPLGMANTLFCPPTEMRQHIPPTLDAVDFRKRPIQGEVNDENASVMGGVAGHAGLFGSALDVTKFAQCMLRVGAPLFDPATVKLFTTRESLPAGTSRTLGWDTPSAPSQSGKHFSTHSYGHLGYTGTSLWIDPTRDLSIVLLTNRTWPDNQSQAIKQVRPAVHDAIIEALA
ncbi:MAG: beta-lactamase [Acidobacteriales bacterium]|nr:beta-lactamase [Terriglobales bacterium]